MTALIDAARERGATCMTLEVRPSNRAALRLYEGFGFIPKGVRPGYYSDTGEDALIMWREDLSSAPETTQRREAKNGNANQ